MVLGHEEMKQSSQVQNVDLGSPGLHVLQQTPRSHPTWHRGARVSNGALRPCCDTNKTSDNTDRKYHSHSLRFWNNFFPEILVLAFPPASLTHGSWCFTLSCHLPSERKSKATAAATNTSPSFQAFQKVYF